ncbi:hypothetical protein QJQ45_026175 [Haematococcus lacustris]|nr:hypothetical protein QJQ45_026175 [Haematococcus lacustris]
MKGKKRKGADEPKQPKHKAPKHTEQPKKQGTSRKGKLSEAPASSHTAFATSHSIHAPRSSERSKRKASARAAVDKQQAAVHEQQQQAVGVWQCRLQVATGCRCAAVHEQQQQVAVHVLQWISSSSRLSCMNLVSAAWLS